MPDGLRLYDQVLKVLGREYPEALLRLAFPGLDIELVGTILNVEITLPEQRVDFVHEVAFEDEEYILHIEFQTEHRPNFPQRMFEYSAALTRLFQKPVLSLAVYIRPRRKAPPAEYRVKLGEHPVNRFTYPVVKLWEYRDRIWTGEFRELAPLLLELVEEKSEAVLVREKELILQERDKKKRGTLLATAVTIASRYFERDFLWRFFREEVEAMKEAPFIVDWIEEGIQKGYQQGMQKGLQQGLQQGVKRGALKLLRRVVVRRFNALPAWLDDGLSEKLSEDVLDYLLDLALDSETLEEFEEKAKRLLPKE